jgi:hypothetical protein
MGGALRAGSFTRSVDERMKRGSRA